jgi:transcriptional regulator of acetoin/glycerol metabolism
MKNANYTSYFDDPGKYKNAVRNELDKFLKTGDVRGFSVRHEILESWRLSLENGLLYSKLPKNVVLNADEINRLIIENSKLIKAARPILNDFSVVLKAYGVKNTVINLCSEDTVILCTLAGEASGERAAKYQNLLPGAILNEKHVGTTGVSMAKNTKQPYAVYGEEHFAELAKSTNCIAAPIVNPKNKSLSGIVALSAENLNISANTMCMVAFVAKSIENKLLTVYADASYMLEQSFRKTVKRNVAELILSFDADFELIASSELQRPLPEGEVPFRILTGSVGAQLKKIHSRFLYGFSSANGLKTCECNTKEHSLLCIPVSDGNNYIGMTVCVNRRHAEQYATAGNAAYIGRGGG